MLVTMSNKELHRLPVIQAVIEIRLRRSDAASQLQLTKRQGSATHEPLSRVWR